MAATKVPIEVQQQHIIAQQQVQPPQPPSYPSPGVVMAQQATVVPPSEGFIHYSNFFSLLRDLILEETDAKTSTMKVHTHSSLNFHQCT